MVKKRKLKKVRLSSNTFIVAINIVALIILSLFLNVVKAVLIVLTINLIYFLIIKNWAHIKSKLLKSKSTIKNNKKSQTKASTKSTKAEKIKVKTQNKKEKTNKKKKKKKIWNIIFFIILIFIILIIAAVGVFISMIVKEAPEFNEENLYMKEPSILYDKNGVEFARLGAENREIISYDQVSEALIDAIIATEDSRFFQHNGVDLPRFIKASIGQVLGHDAGGASTITMQISKKSYTSSVASGFDGIKRKFTDIYMSVFKLEKKYTKQQILELYVNSNSMGAGTYGVEEACQTYFGKSAKDVNVAEAAMIAGLFQAPTRYNPLVNPEAAEKRRKEVLNLMQRHGYITEEEKEIAKALTIDKLLVKETDNSNSNKFQAFVDTVVNEVIEKTGSDPYNVGMEIYTTMDRDKQAFIDNIMYGNGYNWDNEIVTAGIAVIDVHTGSLVAVGGNRTTGQKMYNNATMNKRQIGSTAKPLYDYGPAIEYNNWSPGNPIIDEEYTYSNGISVNNYDGKYKGSMTLRSALADSRNIPALKTFQQVNNGNIKTFVTNLGLHPEIEGGGIHEAHAIGAYNGESALSMAGAYSAFANKGYFNEPHSFTKVIYRENDEVFENIIVPKKAMSEETAYMITSSLYTTAPAALGKYKNVNGYTFAAKTGTTNYDSKTAAANGLPSSAIPDLWVIGYDGDYSIGVWYGYDKIYKDHYLQYGAQNHKSLFQTVASGILTGKVIEKPAGVEEVKIELETYPIKLPSAYTPSNLITTELFKKGTAPTEVSDRFSQLSNVTNLTGNVSGNTVNLSWNGIKTPNAINSSAISNEVSRLYKNVNSGVARRIEYNNNYVGSLVYDVYLKDSSGRLSLVGSTSDTRFSREINVAANTSVTFVVKSAYSIFKSNASSGSQIKLTFEGSSSPSTNDNPPDTPSQNTQITAELVGKQSMEVALNSTYTDQGVSIYQDNKKINNLANIIVTATGENTNMIYTSSNLNRITDKEGVYTITYKITYKDFSETLIRYVTVK